MKYTVMVKPNNNIAFVEQYLKMCCFELGILLDASGVEVTAIESVKLDKAYFVNFETYESIGNHVLVGIYQMSFYYMLFQLMDGGMLKPVVIDYEPDFEDDLSIRLKYSGKTNEQITRLMMMTAYHLSDYHGLGDVNILDPMCGRGTTLFEAMISGFNAYGVERDKKGFMEMSTYITRYIKDARFKHTNQRGKVIVGRETIGESFELTYAKDKKDYKSGNVNELKVLRGDTTRIEGAFRKNQMHLIVVDLPYNVQHRGKGEDTASAGLSGLLGKGVSEWDRYLKKGGVIAISWNIYTDKRSAIKQVLIDAGYEVYDDEAFNSLEHRVAQAITRDIIFAKKV